MSKCLAPFSLVLAYPSGSQSCAQLAQPIKAKKMDLATNPVFKAFLAGSFSGTCSTILFQPLDLVKTRQQNLSGCPRQSRGMLSVVRHVLQTEHVLGLWRGIVPSIAKTVPGVGLYFGSLHWLKSRVSSNDPSPLEAVCLGVTARSFAASVMIPITVIKTRFEAGTYNYHRVSQALTQIYSREGVRGLCCGLLPTLLRDAPFSGLYLMFYTQLKRLGQNPESVDRNALEHFSCGIAAGFLASLVTHPVDVMKTRMQLNPAEYSSMREAAAKVMARHGWRGFLLGLAPRMLRRTLMSALAWTVYEEIMRQMGVK